MTGLEIALLIIGVVFFAGSFFFVEKLSSSDLEELQKMSEKELRVLIDKQLKDASTRIDAAIESKFNDSLNKFDRETNRRTTDEIYSITEHADTVRASLDTAFDAVKKSHDEIMFLYNMLGDKQEKVTSLQKQAAGLESNLRNMMLSVEDAVERLESEHHIRVERAPEPAVDSGGEGAYNESTVESTADEVLESLSGSEEISLIEAFEEKIAKEEAQSQDASGSDSNSINDRILAMHREGYSDVEIAKNLGKGLGEIKLVLGLFEEEAS